jgi:hypothetical protein
MKPTKFARLDADQHKRIKEAAKASGVSFQFLLNRVIETGLSVRRISIKRIANLNFPKAYRKSLPLLKGIPKS